MKLHSIVRLGLVNGLVSILLFAGAMLSFAIIDGNGRTLLAAPMLFTLIVTLVGPAIIVADLIAALVGSLAKKTPQSSHLVAMLVAGLLGLAFARSQPGLGSPVLLNPTQLVLLVALLLPWAVGAGYLKAFRKRA